MVCMKLRLIKGQMSKLSAHNVVARIHEHDLASDCASQIATEEECRIANLALLDVAAQW